MKTKSTLFAEKVEGLFFPDRVVIGGGFLVILYFLSSGLLVNNAMTFLTALLAFYMVQKLFENKIRNKDSLHLLSAIIATTMFFALSNTWFVSNLLKFGAFSIFFNLIVLFIIRSFWKISAHTFVYTNVCTVLALIDSRLVLFYIFLPLVIWSRIKLKRHTYIQVIAGGLGGFLLPIVLFSSGYF